MSRLSTLTLMATLAAGPAFASCYESPIEDFFPSFAASVAVQQEVVADRILWAAPDPEAELEGRMAVVPLAASRVIWPVVPDLEGFFAEGGTVEYSDSESPDGTLKGKVATLSKGDDYLVNILFTADPCWSLIGVLNQKG